MNTNRNNIDMEEGLIAYELDKVRHCGTTFLNINSRRTPVQ